MTAERHDGMTAGRQDGLAVLQQVIAEEGARVRITVGNLKGGTAKTTTAVFLASALAEHGRTVLIDADPQESAFRWAVHAGGEFPVPVIPWATRDLARRVADVAGDYDHLVIDTGPQHDAVLRQALLATGRLVVPVGPTAIELQRLQATLDLAAEIDAITHVQVDVLLVKLRGGTRAAALARSLLVERDLPVLHTAVPLRERFATAWGTPALSWRGEYDHVLAELAGAELLERELRRRSQ